MKNVFLLFSFFPLLIFGQTIISSNVELVSQQTTSVTLSWKNEVPAQSFIRYGVTRDLELGELSAGVTEEPEITISGGSPALIYYVQAVAQSGGVTESTDTLAFITRSNSSGEIKTYFTQPVDHNYASLVSNQAIYLENAIDDTLVAYINRAELSIDLALYNTTNSSSVANYAEALNEAFDRGVQVRVIYNENTGNTAIPNLYPEIPRLESPPADFDNNIGIMHHKFFVFDAEHSNPNKPYVWTGSTNLTTQQMRTDANNVIIIQDRGLARTYTLEFNEMWGGNSLEPNLDLSRFGPEKIDDTPHHFLIGGKKVECYFSPSDNVNQRIHQAILDADESLLINTMLITRNDLTNAIIEQFENGSDVNVIVNTVSQTSTFQTLQNTLFGRIAEYSQITGMLHHKTMLANIDSPDAFVLTGSHNWSTSAETRNDENTLIIYDSDIVNQYFQEFMARFNPMASQVKAIQDEAIIPQYEITLIDVAQNDSLYFTIRPDITVLTPPTHGMASGSSLGIVSYLPDLDFNGLDSLQYEICNHTIESYCDSAWLYLTVDFPLSTQELDNSSSFVLYPNPASVSTAVLHENIPDLQITVLSSDGKVIDVPQHRHSDFTSLDTRLLAQGLYFVILKYNDFYSSQQLIISN